MKKRWPTEELLFLTLLLSNIVLVFCTTVWSRELFRCHPLFACAVWWCAEALLAVVTYSSYKKQKSIKETIAGATVVCLKSIFSSSGNCDSMDYHETVVFHGSWLGRSLAIGAIVMTVTILVLTLMVIGGN